MKDHVTSFEMSKKLKEAGIKKRCNYYWFTIGTAPVLCDCLNHRPSGDVYPAYLLTELLAMVEGLRAIHNIPTIPGSNNWICELMAMDEELGPFWIEDTPIEAVAQALLWQKEQGK